MAAGAILNLGKEILGLAMVQVKLLSATSSMAEAQSRGDAVGSEESRSTQEEMIQKCCRLLWAKVQIG